MTADLLHLNGARVRTEQPRRPVGKLFGDDLARIGDPAKIEAEVRTMALLWWMKAIAIYGHHEAQQMNVTAFTEAMQRVKP